jgi:hypothetical protein
VALSYVILGERPSALQLLGVALVLAGLLVAVSGRTAQGPAAPAAPAGAARAAAPDGRAGYRRRSTRIMRHASAASTGKSASKSP